MKSGKRHKKVLNGARQRGGLIPSWVIYCLITVATLAGSTTVTLRTLTDWREAEWQYQEMSIDVERLRKKNEELRKELERLHADPSAVEYAAHGRLYMVRPDEVVVPLDDSPAAVMSAAHAEPPPIEDDNQSLSYLVLALYCGTAILGGFLVVKSLIVLLRYMGRGQISNGPPSSPTDYGDNQRRASAVPSSLVFALFCGLIMAVGFTFSAEKYFGAITLRYGREDLRSRREHLLDAQRRLLLSREEELSPSVLEKRARESGMRPARPSDAPPEGRNVKGGVRTIIIDETGSIRAPAITPLSFKLILMILALFGGSLALTLSPAAGLSALLSRLRTPSIGIERAPGSKYLAVVDFLFSTKEVEETFKPIVADWRTEYFEAVKQKRAWKARWVSVRYSYSFIASMGLSRIFSFIQSLTRAGR